MRPRWIAGIYGFYLLLFAHAVSANIAPLASASASSESPYGQTASKAIDQFIDGHPGDYTLEWASNSQGAGAYLDLAWGSSFYLVDRVVLYDRPNNLDQITAATLLFSDGSSIALGPLDNAGGPTVINFNPRLINGLRIQVDAVSGSTENVGLAEIEVFELPANGNLPPIADAGLAQTVSEGVLVTLEGSGSSDPNGDSLTYQWTQSDGQAMVLSDETAVNPSFIAPSGLLQDEVLSFELVVNDGQINSLAAIVTVTVTATNPVNPFNLAPLASASASSESPYGQTASKAIDQFIDGHPGDYTLEWASNSQGAGAYLDLAWGSSFYLVDRVVLYDRPNNLDQITAATLLFSDGSSIALGPLDNAGGPTVINFNPRLINGLRIQVDAVSGSTANVGLAEIEVFELPANGNLPPIADAGLAQTVSEGVLVTLDGSGSSDPNGDSLTYQWTQSNGQAMVLSDETAVNPSFIVPSGLLQDEVLSFELVVNDGQINSLAAIVTVTVTAINPVNPFNLAPLASASASSESPYGQTASKAIDQFIDGHPGDYTLEWASNSQGAGAYLDLAWGSSFYLVDRVVLYDRPNNLDQITAATLLFSDGSSIALGPLDNAGGPTVINFNPRLINGLRIQVDAVSGSTANVGLAEIEVFGDADSGGAPFAMADTDQAVAEGVTVQLDGSDSYDPNGDPLTYQWTQSGGQPVVLSDPNAQSPTFVAPIGLVGNETLSFELVVNDGTDSSTPAVVSVLVWPTTFSCVSDARVMPLGDSITAGVGHASVTDFSLMAGYRQVLEQNLALEYYLIDFVGQEKSGQGVLPTFDIDHEGHSGFTADQIRTNVFNWLSASPADIILLHIGTNQVGSTTAADIAAILDQIDLYDPNIIVVLAQIIDFADGNDAVADLNSGIVAMAQSRVSDGDRIILADHFGALNYPDDMIDEVHPNLSGYTKMAAVWQDKLHALLPVCTYIAPQVFLTTPNNNANTGQLFSYDIDVAGGPAAIYSLLTSPVGMTIDPSTGTINWIPTSTGLFNVVVEASNSWGSITQSFEVVVSGPNIAPLASASASSESPFGQTASKAIDQFIDGHPGDYTREWASNSQGAGAYLDLAWGSSFYLVNRVVLYDRPNNLDQITAATLLFSDGSSIALGPLDNAGGPTVINFNPRLINGLRIQVDAVSGSTANVGLAEIEVFGDADTGP